MDMDIHWRSLNRIKRQRIAYIKQSSDRLVWNWLRQFRTIIRSVIDLRAGCLERAAKRWKASSYHQEVGRFRRPFSKSDRSVVVIIAVYLPLIQASAQYSLMLATLSHLVKNRRTVNRLIPCEATQFNYSKMQWCRLILVNNSTQLITPSQCQSEVMCQSSQISPSVSWY